MPILVRPIEADEHAALGALTVAAYRSLDGWEPNEYEQELADVATRATQALVLVAVETRDPSSIIGDDAPDPSSIIGGVTYVPDDANALAEFHDPNAAAFRMLAVCPSAHGRGVGEALVRACIDRARDAGRTRLVLHTTEIMHAAHRLYERLGFTRSPEIDLDFRPVVYLLGYTLRINSSR